MKVVARRQISRIAALACAAALVVGNSPAHADSSTETVAAGTSSARSAQAEPLLTGDQNFQNLFASWTKLDQAGSGASLEQPFVSVPSRMPLSGARLTSGYGMRTHPVLGNRRKHSGIDLAAPTGTPVYATADGIIGRADWYSSYGLYISIDHGASMETRYAHLSGLAVNAGDTVRKGDLIGYVGSTGRSTGPHLHYEVRVDGVAVNPVPYMVESETQLAYSNDPGLIGTGGD